jgi:DNA mismatch repair protein MutS
MSQTALNTAPASVADLLAEGHTPMMAQYHEIKARHPDALLFYRMGDFYELFFDDAIKAAETLDITLTKRGKNQENEIPMCGVPHHSCEPYIAKLIRSGYKVAICDQIETPEQAKERAKREGRPASKAMIHRDVVRIITQGTLTEDTLLDSRENNYLAAIAETGGQYGFAWLELSTGDFRVQPLKKSDLGPAIERISPQEILVSDKFNVILSAAKDLSSDKRDPSVASLPQDDRITIQPSSLFDSENARGRLEKIFGVGTLESFGAFSRAEIAAAGALIDYVERTQKGKMPYLARPQQISAGAMLEIDAATRRNLELTRTLTGERKGSLLDTIDRTITGAGARLLQSYLSAPLTNLAEIHGRQARVQCFADDPSLRGDLRDYFRALPDMERGLSRLSLGRGTPRDLSMLRDGLKSASHIRSLLQDHEIAKIALKDLLTDLREDPELARVQDELRKAIIEEPPALLRDGGFVAPGFDKRLDELKTMRDDSRRLVAALQGKYQQDTGINALKVKHNNVLGYFIEVPPKHADALMVKSTDGSNPFIHRQTTAGAVRFTTTDLAELERDISSAADKALALELQIFAELSAQCTALAEEIGTRARALAALDVSAALAELAVDQNYTRPLLDHSLSFEIRGGRHPVVEAALKRNAENFVPNDSDLNPLQRLWLLTGPNMAGKSTYLRQNALITILAQIGSFVPADSARIGIVDRLFSRVGASDDLARGRSTFMVEMVETAAILNQATERSLVILDEIGRGTATFDGLSIAWACVEHLHEINKCRGLFATHYHELTALASKLGSLSCHSMQVREWQGDIIFLHSVTAGSADRSYGIHVAKLAGVPDAVIGRAREVLNMLQSSEQSGVLSRLADDLPLFATNNANSNNSVSPLQEKLDSIDVDALSPKEALDLLYALKALRG